MERFDSRICTIGRGFCVFLKLLERAILVCKYSWFYLTNWCSCPIPDLKPVDYEVWGCCSYEFIVQDFKTLDYLNITLWNSGANWPGQWWLSGTFNSRCMHSQGTMLNTYCKWHWHSFSILTRGQSNLTKSASRGAHSPVRGHPGGRKLYHWIPGVGFPISVP